MTPTTLFSFTWVFSLLIFYLNCYSTLKGVKSARLKTLQMPSYLPFKEGLFFFQSCGAPAIKLHLPSKPNTLGAPLSSAVPTCWGAWCGNQNSHSCERNSTIFYNSPMCGFPTQGVWDLIIWQVHPSYPILLWLVLYVFSCRRFFLVGSCLFHWWLFCR